MIFCFGSWSFILVSVKFIHIKIDAYNIQFSPYFKGFKSNILHITVTKSDMNEFCKDYNDQIQYESICKD